jgi:lipid-A-disaccharide synthase-like uncharacterized protein
LRRPALEYRRSVEYVPLLFLALVVVGGAVVLRSMIRLKRAAVEALEVSRQLDEQLQSLRIETRPPGQDPSPPSDTDPPA